MSVRCFHTLSLSQFVSVVDAVHASVARDRGRIEITRDGCDEVCVLISKAELEGLERALEILSETAEFRAMCDSVASVAASAAPFSATQSA